jgi:hypothetical protein
MVSHMKVLNKLLDRSLHLLNKISHKKEHMTL